MTEPNLVKDKIFYDIEPPIYGSYSLPSWFIWSLVLTIIIALVYLYLKSKNKSSLNTLTWHKHKIDKDIREIRKNGMINLGIEVVDTRLSELIYLPKLLLPEIYRVIEDSNCNLAKIKDGLALTSHELQKLQPEVKNKEIKSLIDCLTYLDNIRFSLKHIDRSEIEDILKHTLSITSNLLDRMLEIKKLELKK